MPGSITGGEDTTKTKKLMSSLIVRPNHSRFNLLTAVETLSKFDKEMNL